MLITTLLCCRLLSHILKILNLAHYLRILLIKELNHVYVPIETPEFRKTCRFVVVDVLIYAVSFRNSTHKHDTMRAKCPITMQ